jgi:dipeptidyl aminopeptidase/acylaminoacyl peptidase
LHSNFISDYAPPTPGSLAGPTHRVTRTHSRPAFPPSARRAAVIRRSFRLAAVGLLAVTALAADPRARVAPLSIAELRTARFSTSLRSVRALPDGPGFTAQLLAYSSGPLTVYAFVATPVSRSPTSGYPILVANHGTHPDPPRYGFTAEGVDARPGDYYRSIPELYAKAGFLVVMPDYRGHNSSEGADDARGGLASAYFTQDVLALLAGVSDLPQGDARNIFMWGHSLGGDVTLRALLATDRVRGASLWSTVGGDIWERAYYYSRYRRREADDESGVAKASVAELQQQIARLGGPYDWEAREPGRHLPHLRTPVILHHAIGDTSAKYDWSERLAGALYVAGVPYVFHTYRGTDHFFQGEARQAAVARDVAFFTSLMAPPAP